MHACVHSVSHNCAVLILINYCVVNFKMFAKKETGSG